MDADVEELSVLSGGLAGLGAGFGADGRVSCRVFLTTFLAILSLIAPHTLMRDPRAAHSPPNCGSMRNRLSPAMVRHTPMRSLDLFSGLGGITYALRGYFEPALYCDIDRASQDVLAHHIDTGMLPPADLVGDVCSIHKVPEDVRAIVGGSPCQSISCMGKRDGISESTKSGLFLEIVRIVDENPQIDVLFLENVSNILRLGAREVVETLSERGFSLSWVIRHAKGHGAPHKRARWFCLAVRDTAHVPWLDAFEAEAAEFPEWSKSTEPPRVAVKPAFGLDPNYHANWAARQKLLGNSVVPIVVRGAFEELAKRRCKWSGIAETLGEFGTHFRDWKHSAYPEHALVRDGCVIQLPVVDQPMLGTYKPSTTVDVEGTLMQLNSWPTPRAMNPRGGRITSRSVGDLGTMLVHCFESQIYVASSGLRIAGSADTRMVDVATPNTACVEWAMGYPIGWTCAQYPDGQERKTWPLDGTPDEQVPLEEQCDCDETSANDMVQRDIELDELAQGETDSPEGESLTLDETAFNEEGAACDNQDHGPDGIGSVTMDLDAEDV